MMYYLGKYVMKPTTTKGDSVRAWLPLEIKSFHNKLQKAIWVVGYLHDCSRLKSKSAPQYCA